MKATLKLGIKYEHKFLVPSSKMVPALYPEAEEFLAMPEVFATGFMVGFLEWACIKCVNPHIDWPTKQTLGTHIDVTHQAATPPPAWRSRRQTNWSKWMVEGWSFRWKHTTAWI